MGFSTALASSSLLSLTGCSSLPTSSQSYIHNVVRARNVSTVFYWTDIMLQAIRNLGVTPPPATRAFAMAHLAGFLAVNGIEKKYNTPFALKDAFEGLNAEAAYGTAFSMALSEALEASFAIDRKRFLLKFENVPNLDASISYGEYAANHVIKMRINDGAEPNKANFYLGRYSRRHDVLRWAPTGPFYDTDYGPRFNNFSRGLLPGWGAQKPWMMKNTHDFRAVDFIDPKSPEFAEQFKTIATLGEAHSKVRTADQTQIAFFWEDGPRGVTPPGHWQIIAMDILQNQNHSLLEQARCFAMLSMAQADAGITTWDSKYAHDIVRPETAIRQRTEEFNNPLILPYANSDWRSLIPTPSFPAYTSGHSCFSATSARVIANFIGTDQVSFSSHSPDLVNWPEQLRGVIRSYKSLWQAAEEGGMSRIYGGIHWDADNYVGLDVGKRLADYVFSHSFVRRV